MIKAVLEQDSRTLFANRARLLPVLVEWGFKKFLIQNDGAVKSISLPIHIVWINGKLYITTAMNIQFSLFLRASI